MKINSKRKHEIVEIDEDEDFPQHESEFLGESSYKKYKFIQAFSRLSINDEEDSMNIEKNQSDSNLDLLYSDLTKMFTKNIKISHSEKICYKKKHQHQHTDKSKPQIKYVRITDGQKDINLFKHQQKNLVNVIFNLCQEVQPCTSDSLVLYKGNSMNTLMSNFMNFLQRTKFISGKQKSITENKQKESLKVIIEESDTEEEGQKQLSD
ncbi:hypothetical protein TTHERM_00047320 (macronuclear) [Tetrahymena thermophila SB210]|uniref:Uncharacterized protein n=1 Tax=Tetrahymena thermophila (strain SB210) TaxID=312017 RepID=Q23DF9_TETTS|nr:hypothetical protein TTHERM_00047320 [Tetrahymena thermophila SB210]EAR94367.1 hypothetical protein TTHERM_00047320 [Tetrahymena thermophila SB210]|eukprot:XP_001014727.1 hypothetical protein TTHERM_00047320 [Tetrahymena thermophila SB210]